jgi:hypothetical protein
MSEETSITDTAPPAPTAKPGRKPGRKPPLFPSEPDVKPTEEQLAAAYKEMRAKVKRVEKARTLVALAEKEAQSELASFTTLCGKGPFEIGDAGESFVVTENHVGGEVVLRWEKKMPKSKMKIADDGSDEE